MLASVTPAPLDDPHLVYEPKYDGIRAIAEVGERRPPLVAPRQREDVAVPGDRRGAPAVGAPAEGARRARRRDRRAECQGRTRGFSAAPGTHPSARCDQLHSPTGPPHQPLPAPTRPTVAFIVFDLLRDGTKDCAIGRSSSGAQRSSDCFRSASRPRSCASATIARGDGRALYDAGARPWMGRPHREARAVALQVRQAHARLAQDQDRPRTGIRRSAAGPSRGRRAPTSARCCWESMKADRLVYVGHIGTGFNERELARVMALLKRHETTECPFSVRPKTNERPHWTRPELVAQVRFTEWTADGKLRHPVYLGLRDDKKASDVRREEWAAGRRVRSGGRRRRSATKARAGRRGPEPRTTNHEPRTSSISCKPSSSRDATAISSFPTAIG